MKNRFQWQKTRPTIVLKTCQMYFEAWLDGRLGVKSDTKTFFWWTKFLFLNTLSNVTVTGSAGEREPPPEGTERTAAPLDVFLQSALRSGTSSKCYQRQTESWDVLVTDLSPRSPKKFVIKRPVSEACSFLVPKCSFHYLLTSEQKSKDLGCFEDIVQSILGT